MKRSFWMPVLIVFMVALCITPMSAQVTGSVRGVCKDLEGKPFTGAVVEWVNLENGQKYDIKTNNKGEYFSLGITPGRYKATLIKDGKEIYHFTGVSVSASEEKDLDFDLVKEQAATAQGQGLTPEQLKQQQEQQAKAAKEGNLIKTLNERLAAAKQASDAGNYDAAIATLTEATQLDATRDLLWAKLGEAYLVSASKQTDSAEKTKRFEQAAEDYQKSIDLKQKAFDATPQQKTPDAVKVLAQYYNNLGKAEAELGKTDEAVKAYNQAAQLDPAGAGMYYYNLGGTLTNANIKNDPDMRKAAVQAFDKAIAVDPNRADAYYWKATNLIGLATLQGNKMVAPEGTAESFQKYLELQPTGPHAEEAKAMLASLGATIETSFGKKKTSKK